MNVRVTYIRQKHIESLHRAIDLVAKEKRYFVRTRAPALDELRKFVHRQIREKTPIYVAVEGTQVVGWIDVTVQDEPARRHSGYVGMGVLPGYRRRGIGTRLLHRAVKHAFQKSGLFVFSGLPHQHFPKANEIRTYSPMRLLATTV